MVSVTADIVTIECQLTGEYVLFLEIGFIFVTAFGGTRSLNVK